MGKHMKQSSRRVAKVVGAGLFAGGLLLGAPAGIASADDPVSDAVANASEAGQKAVVAGSQTYQQAVVAGSQSAQTAATATRHALSSALKGLFGR